MSVFEFQEYRAYLRAWVEAFPGHGRGQWRRMATALGVSSTMVSQVMKGERHFNQELASDLADHLGLNDDESAYFFLLIDLARAGTQRLRAKLQKRALQEQTKALELHRRLKKDVEFSEETKALFYSDWVYSGVRNLTSIDQFRTAEDVSARLGLSRAKAQRVIEFLLQNGLCVMENGQLAVGPQKTHLPSDSPWVQQHHRNWRLKALEAQRGQDVNEKNLFYTGPMSMSEDVALQIRRELPAVLERVYKLIGPSTSETVRCLNIDWFEY